MEDWLKPQKPKLKDKLSTKDFSDFGGEAYPPKKDLKSAVTAEPPKETPDMKVDKDKIKKAVTSVAPNTTQMTINDFKLPDMGKEAGVDPEVKAAKERLKAARERLNQLPADRMAKSDKADWMNLAERLGHAFVQLGSGMYGMKHGVDMSGVRFDKNNWGDYLDKQLKILDTEMGQLERGMGRDISLIEGKEAEKVRVKERDEDIALKKEALRT